MLVPMFEEGAGAQGRGAEAQTLIVDHLRRHLPEPLRNLVQPLSVNIGPADDAVAARLRRQLRTFYVLHGRIAARGDDWSVYPRVLEAASDKVIHMDQFTRDATPANPRFGPFVSSLPPEVNVRDEEFPFDFCQDLEAVIHGLTGMAFASVEEHSAAVIALDRALEKAEDSTNHQIDALRAKRAFSLHRLGQTDEAISYLRDRLRLPDPSPHLLRTIAHLLSDRAWSNSGTDEEADLDEARRCLRTALDNTTDPEWETTAYNLVMLLGLEDPQAHELVDRLLARGSSYRKLWYVRKLHADRAWAAYVAALSANDQSAARQMANESARWYSRMLRSRPRVQFRGFQRRWPFVAMRTLPRSPILYGNTKDGHSAAGHRLRSRYFEWRFQRIRNRTLKLADRHLRKAEWNMAYAYFDWASCVGRRDGVEYRAAAFAACCCWKGGRTADGLAKWNKLARDNPNCLLGRALMAAQLRELGFDSALPGDEPTEMNEVMKLIVTRFPGWAWHTDREFISPTEFAELEGDQGS
jgi:tetratricopeptide (TPR) repeat protein